MPKTTEHTPDFADTIGRLKAIAAESGDALLTEGPVHPDHQLLDLCADALHRLVNAQRSFNARNPYGYIGLKEHELGAARAIDQRLFEEGREGERSATPLLRQITKIPATSAAGIYAKAMVVRTSKTAAPFLARSLAEDLIACPGLRASLWPAGDAPTLSGGH